MIVNDNEYFNILTMKKYGGLESLLRRTLSITVFGNLIFHQFDEQNKL